MTLGTAALAAALSYTKPTQGSFTTFFTRLRMGTSVANVAAVATGLRDVEHYDLLVCRIAAIKNQGVAFVGVFGNWFPLESVVRSIKR